MRKKYAIVSVINDLVTDQRVHKVCMLLHNTGFDVLLVGRKLPGSVLVENRVYKTKRFRMLFRSGPLFYLFFNLRLFFFLLFRKASVLVSNDLDTLFPNFLVSELRSIPLVYDSHEIFTRVPELAEGGVKQSVWKFLERRLVPGIKNFFTVNESIASWFEKEYGNKPQVVRNIPVSSHRQVIAESVATPSSGEKKVIILQGAGININRGAEEAVDAMRYLPGCVLWIVGSGDVIDDLKKKSAAAS